MAKAIGIDLGTTYSLAAYLERGRPLVIPKNPSLRRLQGVKLRAQL